MHLNIIPLDETDSYVLFSEHEDIFLFDKDLNKDLERVSMYGNATCGLIGLSNEWAVAGGEHLIIWIDQKWKIVEDLDLQSVYDIRPLGEYEIEILIDPWSEKSAIWKFNIKTGHKLKIRNFKDYQNSPYTEDIKW